MTNGDYQDTTAITADWLKSLGMLPGDGIVTTDFEYETVVTCKVGDEYRQECCGTKDEEVTYVGYDIKSKQVYIECYLGVDCKEVVILGERSTRGELRLLLDGLKAWTDDEPLPFQSRKWTVPI